MWGTNKIAKLRTIGHAVAEIVITLDRVLQEASLGAIFEQLQAQGKILAAARRGVEFAPRSEDRRR